MRLRVAHIKQRLGGVIRKRRLTAWQVLLLIVLVWYVWYFTRASLRIHYSLGTGAYDFGLYDQGMWLLSRAKPPALTLIGRNLFGDHTSFILLLLVPFYWIAPGAGTLFLVQSAALAAGAIPVFLLARRRVGYEWIAFALAIAYLVHPTVGLVNTEDFHPDAFLPALVGFAIYFAVAERWRPYAIAVVLILLVKEDVVLILVPLGIWVALRRDRMYGLITVAVSVAYFVFASTIIYSFSGSGFPNAWRIPFGGAVGLVKMTLTHPGQVVDYLFADGRPWYLWQLGVPFVFGFLMLPELAALAALVVATNVVSNFSYQHQIRYHYSVVIVGLLAMGTAYALGRLRGRMLNGVVVVILLGALWTGFLWGAYGVSRSPRYVQPESPVATSAWDIVDLIPDDAAISVNYRVAAHVARRTSVYMFPNPFATAYYGYETTPYPGGTRLWAADTIEYVMLPVSFGEENILDDNSPAVVWEREKGAFDLVAENAHWRLWKRR